MLLHLPVMLQWKMFLDGIHSLHFTSEKRVNEALEKKNHLNFCKELIIIIHGLKKALFLPRDAPVYQAGAIIQI